MIQIKLHTGFLTVCFLWVQVPHIIRSIPPSKILQLRQQTQVLWDRYFSSIEKIVYTTLEIIRDKLPKKKRRDGTIWNSFPGALLTLPTFSDSLQDFPFHVESDINKFTAVIYCQLGKLFSILQPFIYHRICIFGTN